MDKLPSTFKLGKMAILLFLITTTTEIPRIYPENLYNLEKIMIDDIQSIYNGNEEEAKFITHPAKFSAFSWMTFTLFTWRS